MFRFTAPLWLAGLGALVVPVLLHLWHRRPTRIVRIGSLRGLEGPPGPRALGRRLDDIPLLLLRMALLAAVVIGVAGLGMRRALQEQNGTNVAVLDPRLLADSLAVYADPVVDSLRRSGSPIHLLAPGFPLLGAATMPSLPVSQWALLRWLDDSLPPSSRVTVIAAPTAGSLGAIRPALRSRFEFHLIGSMRPRLPNAAGNGGTPPPILADRPGDFITMEVVVGQGYTNEAEAAEAAWSVAIESASGLPVKTARRESDSTVPRLDTPAIVLWLADQSVSDDVLAMVESGTWLYQLSPGEPTETSDLGILPVATSGATSEQFQEGILQRGAPPPGAPLLADAAGVPLLTVAAHGRGRHYRLATRLHPEWSTLALGADLPELALLTLRGADTGVDAAPVSAAQANPRSAPPGASLAPVQSLANLALLLAALLLVTERLVVHRRHRVVA